MVAHHRQSNHEASRRRRPPQRRGGTGHVAAIVHGRLEEGRIVVVPEGQGLVVDAARPGHVDAALDHEDAGTTLGVGLPLDGVRRRIAGARKAREHGHHDVGHLLVGGVPLDVDAHGVGQAPDERQLEHVRDTGPLGHIPGDGLRARPVVEPVYVRLHLGRMTVGDEDHSGIRISMWRYWEHHYV